MFNFRAWLQRVSGRLAWKRHPLRRLAGPIYRIPRFELLENRVLPSVVTWTGGSADWSVAADWTDQSNGTHHVPGATDNAVINTAVTVTHSTGNSDTVGSLTIGAAGIASNFTLSAGTLTVNGAFTLPATGNVINQGTGTLSIAGGTLAGATIASGTQLTSTGNSTLTGVTLAGQLSVNAGTLTLSGAWSNSGTITSTNATVDLGGTFTAAQLGTFNRTGGTVNLTGTLTNTGSILALNASTGSWSLDGGTINGGTVTVTGGADLVGTNTGGTLAGGVTLLGDPNLTLPQALDLTAVGQANVTVVGGALTLNNATVALGNNSGTYGLLRFNDAAASLSGTGSVVFGNLSYGYNSLAENVSGGTLTIGPGITVQGSTGSVGYNANWGGIANVSVVNQGSIDADSAGTLTVNGASWTNSGALQATGGGTLTLAGAWSNTGTLSEAGATLNLGGSFTTAGVNLGSFTRSGGAVNLTGTLNNAGATLALNAATGSWNLLGGTINGGTVSVTGGADLVGTYSGGTLAGGVTLLGDPNLTLPQALDLTTVGQANVTVVGGALTLNNATVALGNNSGTYGLLRFNDAAASLSGTGSVVFGNLSYGYNSLAENVSGGTLTIGPGITVQGSTGSVGYNANWGGIANVSVVNQGSIDADSAGTLTVNGASWTNSGALQATGGGTLTLAGAWSNTGTLSEAGATLNLGGSFTTAGVNLGSFTRSGGAVNLTGTLNNAGATLALNAATGSWNLLGGTINGGTVSVTGGADLVGTYSGGTLAGGVTLLGDLNLTLPQALDLTTVGQANVTVVGGALTLNNATVALGNNSGTYGLLRFNDAAASLSGTGSVVFGNLSYGYNSLAENVSGGTLTIGPGITVQGSTGSVGYNANWGGIANVSVVNQGTIDADSAGTLTVNGASWTNSGALQATGGGTLTLAGAWSNTGTLSEAGATLNLGGSFTTAGVNLGSFTRSGGAVNLTGTLNNAGATLALNAATGSWNLLGGTINGGTVSVTGGADLAGTYSGGTLAGGVTLLGDPNLTLPQALDLTTVGQANVTVVGGALTLNNATVALGNNSGTYGLLRFNDAAASLSGTGSVVFGNLSYGYNSLAENVSGGTLTIGPGITVQGSTGSVGYNANWGGIANVSVVNQGSIDADSAGTLTVNGASWTNSGALQATGGGTLTLAGAWSNTGTLSEAGATLNLGGSFTTAGVNLGSFTRSGGAVNLTGTLNNAGATLALNAATGSWNLLGGTINGGTVSVTGGADLVGTYSGGTLAGGVTLLGDLNLTLPQALDLTTVGQANVTVVGGALTLNNATVALGNNSGTYGLLRFNDAAASLSGTGSVVFGNLSYGYNSLAENVSGGTLTIGPGITVQGSTGSVGYNANWGGIANVSVVNQGTIDADSAGTLTVNGASWTNQGTVEATTGGTITAQVSPTNLSAGTLTGGTWKATGGGILRLILPTALTTNAATILLDGAASAFYSTSGTTSALSSLTSNAAGGSLTIQNGFSFTVPAGFSNAGTLTVGPSSTLQLAGTYTQTGGTTQIQTGTVGARARSL